MYTILTDGGSFFKGAGQPKGTEVKTEPGRMPLSLNLGWALNH